VIDDERLRKLADRLCKVDGLVGVLLGGSRARGEHTAESDFDLGLYYRPRLDVEALQHLARDVGGPAASVTRPGEWGPWVDGGGWLHIDGTPTDWIYRDLDRVRTSCDDAREGGQPRRHRLCRGVPVPRRREVCAQALHGQAGVWLINEKGAVASAGRLPGAPSDFSERAKTILAHLGVTPGELSAAITSAADLLADTTRACRPPR
jgi:hypothetical protein